ncbi:hypothetical protein CSC66_16935, partial [Pseudoxanthomonas kaohsiungensis]
MPADVLDRHAGVGLLEDGDDLGLGETGLLHGTSWLGKHARKFYLWGVCDSGKLTIRAAHEEHRQAYGSRRLWRVLVSRGEACGRHRVARLRRQHGV